MLPLSLIHILTPQVINKTTDTSFHLIIFVEILMCSQQPDVYKRQEYILDADVWEKEPGTYPAFNYQQMPLMGNCKADLKFMFMPYMAQTEEVIACLKYHPEVVIISPVSYTHLDVYKRQSPYNASLFSTVNNSA